MVTKMFPIFAVIGGLIGAASAKIRGVTLLTGIGLGVGAGYTFGDQPRFVAAAQEEYEESLEEQRKKQLESQLQTIGAQKELTKKQMKLQSGQQAIQMLTDAISAKQQSPEILTLPQTWQPTTIDRINMKIEGMIGGLV